MVPHFAAEIHWKINSLYFIYGLFAVWQDWAIYWTLDNFINSLATITLPKYPTFLENFCKGVIIYHFSSEIKFGAIFTDIWWFFLVTLIVWFEVWISLKSGVENASFKVLIYVLSDLWPNWIIFLSSSVELVTYHPFIVHVEVK